MSVNNYLGNEGTEAIAEALETNTSLTKLWLYLSYRYIYIILIFPSNKIGPKGAKAIAKSLKTNTSLTTIYFFGMLDTI